VQLSFFIFISSQSLCMVKNIYTFKHVASGSMAYDPSCTWPPSTWAAGPGTHNQLSEIVVKYTTC
jgi:hypothetical protein